MIQVSRVLKIRHIVFDGYLIKDINREMFEDSIKATELAKIKCGKEHFIAIDKGVGFELADRFPTLEEKILANEI